jgi:hypothetical protein
MNADRARKVAEALGLSHYDFTDGTQWRYPTDEQAEKWIGTVDDLIAWLASPDGEKAVRDKVRKLWQNHPGEYGYRAVHIERDVEPDGDCLLVLIEEIEGTDSEEPEKFRVVVGAHEADDTEFACYLSALEWLDERKGK